jgi:hypothetical protein
MGLPNDLASRLLRLELQLDAYQKLHSEELLELRQALNACKRAIAALDDEKVNGSATLLMTNPVRRKVE